MNAGRNERGRRQQAAAVTFVLAACWVAVALFAGRTLQQSIPAWNNPFAHELLDALLVFAGLYWIGRRLVHDARPLSSIGLVERPGGVEELGVGLAIGWGISVAMLLPALLTLRLQSVLLLDRLHWQQALLGLLLLVCNALVTQLVMTGLLFRSLVRATSESLAAACFSLLAGALLLLTHNGDVWQAIFVALAQFLFSLAALRTRAIWIPLGIQVGWGVMLMLLFGVRSFYWPTVAGPVQSYITGPRALTGSYLGPEASAWAVVVLLAALAVLWRATRDYAWHYTYEPIEGAGYAMDVAPPKEHTRMEEESARKSETLVQILPAGSGASRDHHGV